MVEGRACTHSEFRLQASKVKRLESLSRPPCYNEVVSSLGRSAFLLSMSQIDAIDIGARETSQESGHSANDSTRRVSSRSAQKTTVIARGHRRVRRAFQACSWVGVRLRLLGADF
jgi:hypothetical protein